MGRRTTRRRQKQVDRPSTFFLIALAIGLILFVVIVVTMVRRPAKPEPLGRGAVEPAVAIQLT